MTATLIGYAQRELFGVARPTAYRVLERHRLEQATT
jgi:hypothetical protein